MQDRCGDPSAFQAAGQLVQISNSTVLVCVDLDD